MEFSIYKIIYFYISCSSLRSMLQALLELVERNGKVRKRLDFFTFRLTFRWESKRKFNFSSGLEIFLSFSSLFLSPFCLCQIQLFRYFCSSFLSNQKSVNCFQNYFHFTSYAKQTKRNNQIPFNFFLIYFPFFSISFYGFQTKPQHSVSGCL